VNVPALSPVVEPENVNARFPLAELPLHVPSMATEAFPLRAPKAVLEQVEN